MCNMLKVGNLSVNILHCKHKIVHSSVCRSTFEHIRYSNQNEVTYSSCIFQ